MKVLGFLTLLLLAAIPAKASDIYFAQTAAGSGNGTSCANARAASSHVSGDDTPGVTLHLCGTFTGAQGATAFKSLANGTSGNPVTILLEAGAVLTSPAWGGSGAGAITVSNNFVVVDGGSNGTIESTENGDSGNTNCLGGTCTIQQANTYGVFSTGTNVIVQNLNVTHLCMHTFQTGDAGFYRGNCVSISLRGNNSQATENTLDNASVGVEVPNVNTIDISFNTMSAISRFVTVPIITGSAMTNIRIHNNHFSDPWPWDETANDYHHNGIHYFTSTGVPGAGVNGLYFYYNLLDGIWGEDTSSHVTSGVFINDAGLENNTSNVYIFRNVFAFSQAFASSYPSDGFITSGFCSISTCTIPNSLVANNTMIGKAGEACFTLNDTKDSSAALNNLCAASSGGSTWNTTFGYPSALIDYNIYAGTTGGVFPVTNSSGSQVIETFAGWHAAPYTFDTHGSNPTLASVNLATSSPYTLGAGSTAIGAALNLTSTWCVTVPEVCVNPPTSFGRGSTNNGSALPTTGNWDAGAYQSSGTPTASTPSCTNPGGTYDATQSVTCTVGGGAPVMCFTTNGTTPATNGGSGCTTGTLYSGAISITTTGTSIKIIAGGTGFFDGSVDTETYTLTVATPTFNPIAGVYLTAQSVAISSTTSGAIFTYTTDGSTPVPGSHGTVYSSPVSVPSNLTLKAVGVVSGFGNSAVGSASYVIGGAPPAFSVGAFMQ